ncbi:predicted protein [Uncinocarpus reesii 1704]|uniref:Uncharacterized protein n=1 Tax=Uncinocarpus reesii (strain UAMH 1704) TaxID=336963 RepID=C4JRH8_UNCRE|nr:uncharacterized protein UREG_05067 [Uncinocarpus reesii 1704]EEP80225.1 predicted protein [Uncinocarpus reesii 1704]
MSQVESVRLEGNWDGGANSSVLLHLTMKLKASPNATIPIFQLDDGLQANIIEDRVYQTEDKDLETFSTFGNLSPSICQLAQRDRQSGSDNLRSPSPSTHETPRRLYRNGMQLSPSPTKERLFPPSPATSSGSVSLDQDPKYDMTNRVPDLRQCTELVDGGKAHKVHEELHDPDIDRSQGAAAGKENASPEINADCMGTFHRREASGMTAIHWTPKRQNKSTQDSYGAGRQILVSPSPRASGINIPKRGAKSMIPVKSQAFAQEDMHSKGVYMANNSVEGPETPWQGEATRKNGEFGNARYAQTIHSAGAKLPNLAYKSGFSPVKGNKTPIANFGEQRTSVKSGINKSSPSPSRPTYRRGFMNSPMMSPGKNIERAKENNLLLNIESDSEPDVFYEHRPPSDFLSSWLYERSLDTGSTLAEVPKNNHPQSEPRKSTMIFQRDEWQLERGDSKSPLLSDRISLPSPTPSSKLSMPWNSAEELAERKAEYCSLLDLENIEYHPAEPLKPEIVNVEGVLSMVFLHDTVSETVIYEAEIEVLEHVSENHIAAQNVSAKPEVEPGAAVKWQVEFTPSRCIPKLSLLSSHSKHKTKFCRWLHLGPVRLDLGITQNSGCMGVCECCGGQDEIVDGEDDLKLLLHQFASYRWLLIALEGIANQLERIKESISVFHPAKAMSRPKRVLSYGFLVLVIAIIGGFFIIPIENGAHYGLDKRSNTDITCLPGAVGCHIPPRHIRMIAAGRSPTSSESLAQSAQQVQQRPKLNDESNQNQDTAVSASFVVPRTATTPASTTDTRNDLAQGGSGSSHANAVLETGSLAPVISATKIPLPTATFESRPGRKVKTASKDCVRDRIDRFLGWKGPLMH